MMGMIVGLVAFGHTTNEILTAHPYIDEKDIRQALANTAWACRGVRGSPSDSMKLLIDVNDQIF